MEKEKLDFFWNLGLNTIRELETNEGILASASNEIYGCIFGRDSLITCLQLLKVYKISGEEYFLNLSKKVLVNLAGLQGKEINIESGEEPGKCIHEFRPNNHQRLTQKMERPWYIYADNKLRNYDSLDATPLFLIAVYRHWQASKDEIFLREMMPHVELAINWLLRFGDSNQDGFYDFQLNPRRKSGGLPVQNWMDSSESVFHEDESEVVFPVAPVEVQAYAYLALKLWAKFFAQKNIEQAKILEEKSAALKKLFNQKFINQEIIASALDGAGKPVLTAHSSIGHCLWASLSAADDGVADCVVEKNFLPFIAQRLLADDMFAPEAGIRTLSSQSRKFVPNSYHNGSIWPHDNGMIAEGLENFGFTEEALKVRNAVLRAWDFFKTPIELFVFENGQFFDYHSARGQCACRKQAWSAVYILASVIALSGTHPRSFS